MEIIRCADGLASADRRSAEGIAIINHRPVVVWESGSTQRCIEAAFNVDVDLLASQRVRHGDWTPTLLTHECGKGINRSVEADVRWLRVAALLARLPLTPQSADHVVISIGTRA
jgi:hypothetical protein